MIGGITGVHAFHGNRFAKRFRFALNSIARALAIKEPLLAFSHRHSPGSKRIEAIYVVNLDRQPARWRGFQTEASRYKLDNRLTLRDICHRIAAVDAKQSNPDDALGLVNRTYPVCDQYYVDPDPRLLPLMREKEIDVLMSIEETAVALSHIAAWRRLLTEDRSYALILEDDVYFEKRFSTQLNRTWMELPKDAHGNPKFDVLYLSFREVDRGADRRVCSPNVIRLRRGYWWLSGYVVSRAGAEKLLGSLPITGPVDLWMNHQCSELEIFSTPNSVITQRTDLQSDNRYSILPLLTQIGVQTDKTHLILEQTKGRRPVFCIGFDEDSALRLESALSLLGYRCCNNVCERHSRGIQQILDSRLPLLFDAYIGLEKVTNQPHKLREAYPESAFIYSNPKQINGPSETYEIGANPRSFSQDPKSFSIIANGNLSWHTLCPFLQCDIPTYPMPSPRRAGVTVASSIDDLRALSLFSRQLTVQQHDVHPWIVPYERMAAFGILQSPRVFGTRVGTLQPTVTGDAGSFSTSDWTAISETFPSNLGYFCSDNVVVEPPETCRLVLNSHRIKDRDYTAAAIRSVDSHKYGRFEISIKPARCPGVVTAFFLHRNDPWQEIDVEFLGADTRKLLINVYYNPGDEGTRCNFGNRGTPVLIDLTFDASDNFHRYAIEWDPLEIRWFVDDQLVHVRAAWEPTPIPDLPMMLFCSIWPPRSSELAGIIRRDDLPVSSALSSFKRWKWCHEPASAS